jgi:hypothetical protein
MIGPLDRSLTLINSAVAEKSACLGACMGGGRVVCGSCKIEPEVMGYANGDREAICLSCGQRDSVETAIKIVGDNAQYEAALYFELRLSENARGNRFATFKIKPMARQKFSWRLK